MDPFDSVPDSMSKIAKLIGSHDLIASMAAQQKFAAQLKPMIRNLSLRGYILTPDEEFDVDTLRVIDMPFTLEKQHFTDGRWDIIKRWIEMNCKALRKKLEGETGYHHFTFCPAPAEHPRYMRFLTCVYLP